MIFVDETGDPIELDHRADPAPDRGGRFPTITASDTPETGMHYGRFGYLGEAVPPFADQAGQAERLDDLADAMTATSTPAAPSDIPAVFAPLTQFIEHDVVAISPEAGSSGEHLVECQGARNMLPGSLGLWGVYGDGRLGGAAGARLRAMLRDQDDPAKLRVGTGFDDNTGASTMPLDGNMDLLRMGEIAADAKAMPANDWLSDKPRAVRRVFRRPDGTLRLQRAMVGDQRNDQSLALAQLHVAFVRFHNSIVDEAHNHAPDIDDREAVFLWARRMATWHYQWLVLNAYLPMICGPEIVADVIARRAPLYRAFLMRMVRARWGPRFVAGAARRHLAVMPPMPLPLEFSAAAFRLGNVMMATRGAWATSGCSARQDDDIFAYTGGHERPMPHNGRSAPALPRNRAADWQYLASPVCAAVKAQSTLTLSPYLEASAMNGVWAGGNEYAGLAARHVLRLGARLAVPSAQSCLGTIMTGSAPPITALSPADIASGPTGDAIRGGGFVTATPLWFYVLKEAELRGRGGRLGPLGARLVAETLAGLVIYDRSSVWGQPGTGIGGTWSPVDGVTPGGNVIDSLPGFLRAAGVL